MKKYLIFTLIIVILFELLLSGCNNKIVENNDKDEIINCKFYCFADFIRYNCKDFMEGKTNKDTLNVTTFKYVDEPVQELDVNHAAFFIDENNYAYIFPFFFNDGLLADKQWKEFNDRKAIDFSEEPLEEGTFGWKVKINGKYFIKRIREMQIKCHFSDRNYDSGIFKIYDLTYLPSSLDKLYNIN